MSFERTDWVREEAKAKRLRAVRDRPILEAMAQAAVKAELLTGNPHWDTFLSYLQSFRDETAKQMAAFERRLTDPTVVNADEMMLAKMDAVRCRARIEVVDAVLSLPADIIKGGENAKRAIERITAGDTNV